MSTSDNISHDDHPGAAHDADTEVDMDAYMAKFDGLRTSLTSLMSHLVDTKAAGHDQQRVSLIISLCEKIISHHYSLYELICDMNNVFSK